MKTCRLFPLFLILYLIHYFTINQLSSVNEDDTVIDVPVDENCQLTDRHPDPDERMSTTESWNPIPDTASKWHYSWLNNAAKRCQFEMISWNTGILFVNAAGARDALENSLLSLTRSKVDWKTQQNHWTENQLTHSNTGRNAQPPDWKCLNMCDRLNSREIHCCVGSVEHGLWSGPSQKATDLSLATALESPAWGRKWAARTTRP